MGYKLGAFLIQSILLLFMLSPNKDYQLIGNEIMLQDNSLTEVEFVFKGQYENWKNGNPVVVVLHSDKSEFLQKTADLFFNGSVNKLRKTWLSVVFQGRVNAPVFLENDLEIIQYVRQNKGAIAIIYDINAEVNDLKIELKN